MFVGITFKVNIRTLEWELTFRIGRKWFLVFRWHGIILWCPSPVVIYYLNWLNPYTKEFDFAAGIIPPAKMKKRRS